MEQDCVIQALSHFTRLLGIGLTPTSEHLSHFKADTKQENGPVIAVRQIPHFIRFLRGQGFPIDPSEFENNLAPMPNPPAPQAHAVAIGYVSGLADIYDGSYVLGINEYKLKDILSLNRVALKPLSLKAAKKQKT
ncbi:unnamed protein product [Aphanomyces euteiches]